MITITQNNVTVMAINRDALFEELAAAGIPRPVLFHCTQEPFELLMQYPDGTNVGPILTVINAHDASQLSAGQLVEAQAAVIGSGAEDEARAIPDFVGWTPAEAQAWVQANVTDLPTAKVVLVKMAGMVAAINARVFPRVRAERQLSGE